MNWSILRTRFLAPMVAAALSSAALAAPPVTTIRDTLYKADGSLFQGALMITWKTFEAPDSSRIPTNSLTTRVVDGSLFVKLVPTTTAPLAAFYSVRYVADGAVEFSEFWSVPPSDSPLDVGDVRILWPPVAGLPPAEDIVVEIEDVNGLPEALGNRPTKGLAYLPSRAAVIGSTGEIEGGSGAPEDCIRVDGSSGPCSLAPGFVDGEVPSGTINGINTVFTLAAAPSPAVSLKLFRNGLLVQPTVDYSLAGNTITFLPASIPAPGDALKVSYRTN